MKPVALLVEDNETNRYLATFLLERAGCEVRQAMDGAEGLRMAGELHPEIIVLDIEMPELDGYEVAARLRQAPATIDIPILVVSSYALPGDRIRALALGVNDYLEKPYEPHEFVSRVQALLATPDAP